MASMEEISEHIVMEECTAEHENPTQGPHDMKHKEIIVTHVAKSRNGRFDDSVESRCYDEKRQRCQWDYCRRELRNWISRHISMAKDRVT